MQNTPKISVGSYLGSRTISDAYTLEKYSDYDEETEVSSSIYNINGEVTGLNYLGNDYYYIKNLQGDVMYITDDTGEIVVTYYYDAWGTILRISDISDDYIGDINPFTGRTGDGSMS